MDEKREHKGCLVMRSDVERRVMPIVNGMEVPDWPDAWMVLWE
jgi:hypothetical protein